MPGTWDVDISSSTSITEIVEVLSPGVSSNFTSIPNPTTVALYPTGGTSVVEYTLDPSMLDWRPWAKGELGVYAEDVLIANVIALRLKVISGSAKMHLIGGRNG